MTTVKTGDVKRMITSFENVLKKTEGSDGRVDVAALKAEANAAATTEPLAKAFATTIDAIEDRFVRTTTGGSCGTAVKQAPQTLSGREVKSVFAALLEAKSKGIVALDTNTDGKLTPEEAWSGPQDTLAERFGDAAAKAATGKPPPPEPVTGGSVGAGCGGTVKPKPAPRTGSASGSGC